MVTQISILPIQTPCFPNFVLWSVESRLACPVAQIGSVVQMSFQEDTWLLNNRSANEMFFLSELAQWSSTWTRWWAGLTKNTLKGCPRLWLGNRPSFSRVRCVRWDRRTRKNREVTVIQLHKASSMSSSQISSSSVFADTVVERGATTSSTLECTHLHIPVVKDSIQPGSGRHVENSSQREIVSRVDSAIPKSERVRVATIDRRSWSWKTVCGWQSFPSTRLERWRCDVPESGRLNTVTVWAPFQKSQIRLAKFLLAESPLFGRLDAGPSAFYVIARDCPMPMSNVIIPHACATEKNAKGALNRREWREINNLEWCVTTNVVWRPNSKYWLHVLLLQSWTLVDTRTNWRNVICNGRENADTRNIVHRTVDTC